MGGKIQQTERKKNFGGIDFFGWSATTHSYNGRSTDQMGPTEGWSRRFLGSVICGQNVHCETYRKDTKKIAFVSLLNDFLFVENLQSL